MYDAVCDLTFELVTLYEIGIVRCAENARPKPSQERLQVPIVGVEGEHVAGGERAIQMNHHGC